MADQELPIVVCGPKGFEGSDKLPDNREGECSRCGAEIVYRPHIPTPSVLICCECFFEVYEPKSHQILVTNETIEELVELEKKEHH